MGYELACFVGEVDKEFLCTICMMVLENPKETPCEHMFCAQCIKDWMAVESHCPVDRIRLHLVDLRPTPRYFRNLLNKLEVRCELETFGCKAIMPIERLQSHTDNCIYQPNAIVVCDKGCNMSMTRREYLANCFTHLEKRFSGQLEEMKKTLEFLRREQQDSKQLIDRQQDEITRLTDVTITQRQGLVKLINTSNLPPKCVWRTGHNMKISPDEPNIVELVAKSYTWGFAQLSHSLDADNSSFKFQILSKADNDKNEYIMIGVQRSDHFTCELPGYPAGSISYHDKGQLVVEGKVDFGLQKLRTGDVIECGIIYPDNFSHANLPMVQIYFSINRRIVSKKSMKMPSDGFFPTIRMGSTTSSLSSLPKVEYLYM